MKFSEMPYARPDLNELKQQLQSLTDQLKAAPDYAAAREAFLAQQKLSMHIDTLATLSSVRNSIDTRTSSMTLKRNSGTRPGPNCAPMTTHGRQQCWKAHSARNLQRNTAI